MKKIMYIVFFIFWSCGEEENISFNNNVPPNSPSLISPSNNSNASVTLPEEFIRFEWEPVVDTDGDFRTYTFYVSKDINVTPPYTELSEGTNPFRDVYYDFFEHNTTYYWKVEAKDFNNNTSWSPIWSFTYIDGNAPSEPHLVFPLHETECSNDNLTFKWEASENPLGNTVDYLLTISTLPNFSSNVQNYTTTNTEYNISLNSGTAYYWKVAANNGTSSSVSETRSLYTQGDGITNTVPQIEYISPNNKAVITENSIYLEWTATDNETSNNDLRYKVYFSEVGEELALIREDIGISNYEVTELNFDKTYQWSIWVTDTDGATNVGEVRTFTVE